VPGGIEEKEEKLGGQKKGSIKVGVQAGHGQQKVGYPPGQARSFQETQEAIEGPETQRGYQCVHPRFLRIPDQERIEGSQQTRHQGSAGGEDAPS